MKRMNKLAILLLVFALLSTTPTWANAAQAQEIDSEQISQELASLKPYIKNVDIDGVKQQEFDLESAAKAGISQEAIQIAEDMIAYQNDLFTVVNSQKITDITQLSLPVEKYPYMQAFFSQASQRLQDHQTASEPPYAVIDDVNPCGDWDHPVPNYTPGRTQYSSSNPRQTLIDWGFHATAGYACGGDPLYDCENDFTRGRSYTGPYGTCSSPRFRDQGISATTTFSIQYGEPNPEVLSYS